MSTRRPHGDVVFVASGTAPDVRLKFSAARSRRWAVVEHGLDSGERVVVTGVDAVAKAM